MTAMTDHDDNSSKRSLAQIADDARGTAARAYREGVRHWNDGRSEEAVAALDAALRVSPDFPEALCMGGYILGASGKPEAALSFYTRAVQLEPNFGLAWSNLGKILFDLRKFERALEAFNAYLKLAPQDPDAWNNLAGALRELGELEKSVDAAQAALRLRPDFPEAALNLGNALLKLNRAAEALLAYQHALRVKPEFALAHCGAALALKEMARFDEAMAAFDLASRLGSIEAISGKGCLNLLLGNFAVGWEGYEARWLDGKSVKDALGLRFPEWRGLTDPARRVLVLNDHGLGDTIQFCRYLPLMGSAEIDVTFVCPGKLHRLLSTLDIRLVAAAPAGETFDAQIAVSSLPRAFGARLDQALANEPYLSPEPNLSAKWAERIGAEGFKIGVVWQGNSNPEADMARSLPLRCLAPLTQIPNVRVMSLQKGFGTEQLGDLPADVRIETLGSDFDAGPDAFVDTAAVMSHLDLVISCDTSVAHLAGALGRQVWVALKKVPEWRWLMERDDSPWYPTMRLFRQQHRDDWTRVVARMTEAVSQLAQSRATARLVSIPGTVGDLIDRITILKTKSQRVSNAEQLVSVRRELALTTHQKISYREEP